MMMRQELPKRKTRVGLIDVEKEDMADVSEEDADVWHQRPPLRSNLMIIKRAKVILDNIII